MVGNDILFTFSRPVCAGGSPGKGETTFFFGLASKLAPIATTAIVATTSGSLAVAARAP
jgi:hypothetical protein